MANISVFIIILIISTTLFIQTKSQQFSRKLSKTEMGLKRQKLSHLHFYFHDVVAGPQPTVVPIAEARTTNTSATFFGYTVIIDDALTLGPDLSSKIVGRAQGVYASVDLNNFAVLMVLNYVFTEGEFNGSTLSILGRNSVFSEIREMPVVGGSGVFRFASGYAQAKTHTFDMKTGNAVVEYNVYVLHY